MKSQIRQSISKGNYIRALSLLGYKPKLVEQRANGRSLLSLSIYRAGAFEGNFESGFEALRTLEPSIELGVSR